MFKKEVLFSSTRIFSIFSHYYGYIKGALNFKKNNSVLQKTNYIQIIISHSTQNLKYSIPKFAKEKLTYLELCKAALQTWQYKLIAIEWYKSSIKKDMYCVYKNFKQKLLDYIPNYTIYCNPKFSNQRSG